MGPVEPKILEGKVTASFANSIYLGNFCETPITLEMDESDRGSTCLQINHVGHAYHNYQQWMTEWGKRVRTNNRTSTDLTKRPGPSGSIWDNTTIAGSWIEIQDMATTSKKHNRMINNITMAMPHGGIPAAAMNTKNKIKQPTDTSGEGHYNIEASVPSPVVNVLCAGMTEEELSPVVYSSWPGGHKFNATTWNSKTPLDATTTNHTVVDDIFDFDAPDQAVPIFGKYPSPYNTIINKRTTWPNHAIYLLAASPPNTSPPYVLCALRGKQTGRCSTKYSADVSGARLSTSCEQPSNTFQYDRRHPDFEEQTWSGDWKVLAEEWANSLSLNAGITDGAASNARLLTQMMPHHGASGFELDPALPSIAEALAVMAGSTLILSTQDAPFVPFWNYSDKRGNPLSEPAYERFDASIQAVGYASGGAMDWQAVFYVVLVFAFLTSAVCLGFMIVEARGRQVTDFTEPQNLFALAVNSPQTEQLRGACGCGPWGEQLKERWFIGMEEEDEHYYIRSKTEENTPLLRSGRLEQMEVEDGEGRVSSPMVDEFRKVSKRHSLLAKLY